MSASYAYRHFLDRLEATPQSQIALGLDVMRDAVMREGLRRPAQTIVTVAGTNGKGTVAAALSQLCTQRGWNTTLLTSPHLVDFRERIRINGVPIAEETLIEIGDPLLGRYGAESSNTPRPLTYFEMSILWGLAAARHVQSDVLIMEVGLGGRLDATNTIDSDLAIFTALSLDHTALLGDTLAAIAYEKAQVARAGRTAIVHAQFSGVREIQNELETIGARPLEVQGGHDARTRNLALAKGAFDVLERQDGTRSSQVFVDAVLDDFQWPGRLSWVQTPEGACVLIDGAHNAASAAELARFLQDSASKGGMSAVFALTEGHSVEDIAEPLSAYVDSWHVCSPDFARARPAQNVAESLQGAMDSTIWRRENIAAISTYSTVEAALDAAVASSRSEGGGTVLVFGSLYLVGEVYRLWARDSARLPTLSKSHHAISRQPRHNHERTPSNARDGESPAGPPVSGRSHSARRWRAFLDGRWFPADTHGDDADAERCGVLPFRYPRWVVVGLAVAGMAMMTFTQFTVGRFLPLYVRLALGTLTGTLLPAVLTLAVFGLPFRKPRIPTSRQVLHALWMAVVFSVTGALLTGAITALVFLLSRGTGAATFFEHYLAHREQSFQALLGPSSPLGIAVALLTVSILPGICEEFFFRGVLYRMMNGVAVWKRVVFIGVVFGVIHFDLMGLVPLCLFGIVLTWLRAFSGSWVIGAVIHAGFNATALGLSLWGGDRVTETGPPAMYVWLILVPCLLYAGWLFANFCRKSYLHPKKVT